MELTEILHNFKPIVDESIIDYRNALRTYRNVGLAEKEIEEIKKYLVYMLSVYCLPYDKAVDFAERYYKEEEDRL